MAAFRKGHSKVVKWMVKHVCQFPSDTELTRYIATISDKDLLKKCHTCMDIIRVAKERQAAEAAKNASNLLEELDREKNLEESKKAAAARKREKKKRKKMEKLAEKGLLPNEDKEDNKENEDMDGLTTEDEKEKTPEFISSLNQDSGIDANSQASSSEPDRQESSSSSTSGSSKKIQDSNDKENSIVGKTKASSKSKSKKKNKSSAVDNDKEETPPPPMPPTIIPIVSKQEKKRVPSAETYQLPQTQMAIDSPPMTTKEMTKKAGARRRQQLAEQDSLKAGIGNESGSSKIVTSPNSNGKKRASGANATGSTTSSQIVVVSREDAGWKEVVRKSKKVIVPANAISRVIGRGGCNINAIREMSGAHIEVEKLQGKASSAQQTERTILIKGSAEATRQANNWIQQIINSPDKDMADILGKSVVMKPVTTSSASSSLSLTTAPIQSTVIVNSNAKLSQPLTNLTSASNSALTSVASMTTALLTGSAKKVLAPASTNNVMPKPAAFPSSKASGSKAAQGQGSSFAAVASGSGNDSFGMIQTGGTHPGSLVGKANNSKKAKTPEAPQPLMSSLDNNMDFIGTFEVPTPSSVASSNQGMVKEVAKANMDSKDYSPFKSYTGWGNANDKDDKNFATVAASGIDNDLAAKAPGYRISPSGGPLLQQWTAASSAPSVAPKLVRPIVASSAGSSVAVASSVMTSSYVSTPGERSNSAPGSPLMPSPIGPPSQSHVVPLNNNKSPGSSEPDQYRTGSSLSSGIGLSPGSVSGVNHLTSNTGRSMTPDSDSMRTASSNVRSGSITLDKTSSDIFGGVVRPASSGSANAGYPASAEMTLLSAAAQMAFAEARFNPPTSTSQQPNSNFMPPTSKLNPNAPDFMRPQPSTSQDYARNYKNNFNSNLMGSVGGSGHPQQGPSSFNQFNNSNNLPNILTNQGINAYLQSQASLNNSIDLSTFDTNILSGRSIKEINELIAGASSSMAAPSAPSGFNYGFGAASSEPKFNSSRPIGSERSRLDPIKPSNNPWDLSGLYDTLGGVNPVNSINPAVSVNNEFAFSGSYHGHHAPTLEAFNGFNTNAPPPMHHHHQQPPHHHQDYHHRSPVIGMTPNVTPSKVNSDYGDYASASLATASALPPMMPPGVGMPNAGLPPGSAGKKMGYLDQPPLGLAGRGDPASVRRNIVSSKIF